MAILASAACFAAVADLIVPFPTFDRELQLLDVPGRDHAGVAPLQLLLRLQFVEGLLVGDPGLLDLALGRSDVGPGDDHFRVDLGDLLPRGVDGRFLLRAVEAEDRRPLLDLVGEADIGFGDPAVGFRDDGDRPEERGDVGRGRVIVEDHGDQADGEHQAGRDPPPQLEPYRVERDLLAEALALHVAAKQVVRKDGEQGAKE